jgi:hypothetical protein
MQAEQIRAVLDSAKRKMYAARLQRPTPYVDKTVYTSWNALCVSAYLEAARVLHLEDARHFGLRSLDRILAEAWDPGSGLRHIVAYSDPKASRREIAGLLDDYAFAVIACLDAYEITADLSYFNFARRIADAMIEKFFDPSSGGFFDTEGSDGNVLGVLGTRRKPFQDSPTPAGNSAAAIALLRLHGYTNEQEYRNKAEQTLEVFAGLAGQFGIFGGTYGLAIVHYTEPHTQVVIVGSDERADALEDAAVQGFAIQKSVLRLPENEVTPQNLPPALAETVPNVPGVKSGNIMAIVCSNFVCQPPVKEAAELKRALQKS